MPTEPYSILVSQDSYLLKAKIVSLAHADNKEGEIHTFWADEGITDSFWDHLMLQGLFAVPKVLVLRNAQAIPAASLKELSSALGRASSSVTTIVCLEVTFERGKPKIPAHILKLPCFIHAQNKGWVYTLSSLTLASMPNFLQAEAKRHGVQISSSLLAKLVKLLPLDAATAASEIEKLSLTANEHGIIPEQSIVLIDESNESTIFDLLRLIQTGSNTPLAWNRLKDDRGDSLVFSFLAVLIREARALWQILVGEVPSLPPQVIATKKIQAQSLGFRGVAKIFELALDADKGIKSGEKSPEQAFELLVAELFILFQKPSLSCR